MLVPKYEELQGFKGKDGPDEQRRLEMEQYMCLDSFMTMPMPVLAELCTNLICSISAIIHNGAVGKLHSKEGQGLNIFSVQNKILQSHNACYNIFNFVIPQHVSVTLRDLWVQNVTKLEVNVTVNPTLLGINVINVHQGHSDLGQMAALVRNIFIVGGLK